MEVNWNVEKGKLKHKFALLTDDYQLLNESNDEQSMGMQQINLAQTMNVLKIRLSEL